MKKETSSIKKPWPTKAAMEQIYAKNLWGGEEGDFFSGMGSHDMSLVNPYIDVVISFFKTLKNPPIVCDLGCGDFNVGKQLAPYAKRYIGVDIVANLMAHNQELFQEKNLEFHCLNLAEDELPKGDCAILRQVLQHLSNAEVQAIVNKLSQYQYVILTEHIPEGEFAPNKDIISGQGIRLKKQSGVDLEAPPFNLEFKEKEELMRARSVGNRGIIVTKLYTIQNNSI
ncbi:MAG: class I SAM-dependent methyltransferase [Bacteroidetes bacterium]|nr:class I SAM-dependent methyltransferase [Bacteroidota bacterium]